MTILFLTPWYPTSDHGYAGIFVREHAKAVRAAGHDVVVLHTAGIREGLRGLWSVYRVEDSELTEGLPTYRVVHRRLARGAAYALYISSTIAAYRRLRASGIRPDVIHAHVYAPGVPAVLLGRIFGHPVVITEQFSGFPRRTLTKVEAAKARFAFGKAARVLPVSDHLRRAILAYGIAGRFEIVPNVVDTETFLAGGQTVRASGMLTLLFVGNLDENHSKGFPTLLAALRLLRKHRTDWRLDVVGTGTQRSAYERAVAEAGLTDSVTFLGQLRKSDVASMMRASDVFVLPSRYDNMPCAVLEALATGLPVVSTRVGGIPEIVDEDAGVLVPSEQPEALAAALEDVLSRMDFDRDAIAASARSRYGHLVVGQRLAEIYRSVLAETVDVNRLRCWPHDRP